MASIARAYSSWAARAPFFSQVTVATLKTVAADMLVQTLVEKKSIADLDVRRLGVFAGFGCLYLGCAQYAIYVKGMSRLFNKAALDKFCNAPYREKIRDVTGLKILAGTIAIDFFAIQPFIYWPSYYLVKEVGYGDDLTQPTNKDKLLLGNSVNKSGATLVMSDALPSIKYENTFTSAMGKYRKNFWEDNVGMCGFWLPMDLIIYSVPLHLRLHLNHGISFAWVALMSIFRGSKENDHSVAESIL